MSGKYLVVQGSLLQAFDLDSPTPTVPAISFPATYGSYALAMADTRLVVGGSPTYVFDLNSPTPTQPIFSLPDPDPTGNNGYGASVAIDGNFVIVGVPRDDTGANDAGSAYVFDLSSPNPTTPVITLHNPGPAASERFGTAVAVTGQLVIVGAPSDGVGKTYIYQLASPTVPAVTLNNPAIWPITGTFGRNVAADGRYVVVSGTGSGGPLDYAVGYVYDLEAPTPAMFVTSVWADYQSTYMSVAISDGLVVAGTQGYTPGGSHGLVGVYDLNGKYAGEQIASLTYPSFTLNDGFGYAMAISGGRVATGVPGDDTQNTNQGAVYVFSVAPRVASVTVNGGAVQRSRVTKLEVAFDQTVTFTGSPAATFQLQRQSDGANVPLSAVVSNSLNGTTVTLTFVGTTAVDFGSLADGRYTLTALASQIARLDGNGDGVIGDDYVLIGTPTNGLFRLFGDSDGDADVDLNDFRAFRLTFGSTSTIFDFDKDGDVDATDFGQFRGRFGAVI